MFYYLHSYLQLKTLYEEHNMENEFNPYAFNGWLGNTGNFETNVGNMNSALSSGGDMTLMQSIMGKLNGAGDTLAQNQSGVSMGLGALQSIAGAWNTFNQNKLQKDALNFQKQQYATNLAMNKKSYNASLSDRQDRRVSANPNAESVASYMSKWGA